VCYLNRDFYTHLASYVCDTKFLFFLWNICRHNLDYIVDKVCLQLRSPSINTKSSAVNSITSGGCSDGNNASTHLIVDFVFSTLDTTVQDSSEGSGSNKGE